MFIVYLLVHILFSRFILLYPTLHYFLYYRRLRFRLIFLELCRRTACHFIIKKREILSKKEEVEGRNAKERGELPSPDLDSGQG